MLKKFWNKLERFGGHKRAGWLSVKLEKLDEIIEDFQWYCNQCITDEKLIKSVKVDTKIYENERNNDILTNIDKLAPFGEGNREPVFLLENVTIEKIEQIGKKTKTHLKIHGKLGDKNITTMFRWKWADADELIEKNMSTANIVGRIRKDTYNGWFYLEWLDIK
jgi:single-stranded-DNA-specific exonuclease